MLPFFFGWLVDMGAWAMGSYRLGCARGLLGSNNGREGKEESLGEMHCDALLFNKCISSRIDWGITQKGC